VNAVALRLGFELRRRWKAWLSLALLLSAFGGSVLAAAAGARRTHSAYPRYLVSQKAFDQFMLTGADDPEFSFSPREDQLRALPEVEAVASAYFIANTNEINSVASGDPAYETAFNIPTAYKGRLPRPDRVDEAAIPIVLADKLGLAPGDPLTLNFVEAGSSPQAPRTVPVTFTVTGISVAPAELPPGGDIPPPMRLTPAFYARYSETFINDRFTMVRLHNGARDLASFRERLDELGGGKPILGFTQKAVSKNVQRSFDLQAATLWMLAVMLGVAGLAIFSQTLARQIALEAEEFPVLRSLGMTRRQLAALGIARGASVGVVGALGAALVALLLSPLTPTGLARAVETRPGFAFDGLVLGAGVACILGVVLLVTLLPAWLAARRAGVVARATEDAGSRSAVSRAIARVARTPTVATGVRFALEPGRGPTAVPVRSTLTGAVLGLAALTMAFTFGGGLDHLLDTPRLYGVQWDLIVDVDEEAADPATLQAAVERVGGLPGVAAAAPAVLGLPFVVNGEPADALGLRVSDQRFLPPLISGRMPQETNDIVIGPKTSRLIGKGVGDSVEITLLGGAAIPARIAGIGVLPSTGHTGNLGEGTLSSLALIEEIFGEGILDEVIVRLEPNARASAVSGEIRKELGALVLSIDPPQSPSDIVSFGRGQSLPFMLAGVLGVMAAGTIAHLLITGIARRRRDLAILKTVGFVRRQVRGTVAWQASILAGVAALVGVPLGIAAGRWAWTSYADSLGVIPVAIVPLGTVLAVVPGALLLANLLAIYPGLSAARTPSAIVLRAE
jgi:putative ABC transport system permease protein